MHRLKLTAAIFLEIIITGSGHLRSYSNTARDASYEFGVIGQEGSSVHVNEIKITSGQVIDMDQAPDASTLNRPYNLPSEFLFESVDGVGNQINDQSLIHKQSARRVDKSDFLIQSRVSGDQTSVEPSLKNRHPLRNLNSTASANSSTSSSSFEFEVPENRTFIEPVSENPHGLKKSKSTSPASSSSSFEFEVPENRTFIEPISENPHGLKESNSTSLLSSSTDSETDESTVSLCSPDDEYDWTYNEECSFEKDGQYPPEKWYLAYPDCGGSKQSPINLSFEFSVPCHVESSSLLSIISSGNCTYQDLAAEPQVKTWEISFDDGTCGQTPTVKMFNNTYSLAQLHFHSPSEHTIGAGYFDVELHLVHVNEYDDNDYLVLGVFLQASTVVKGNIEIHKYWQLLLDAEFNREAQIDLSDPADPYQLLPGGSFYTYSGSLTAPPCTETVTWVLFEDPVSINAEELNNFRDGMNYVRGSLSDLNGDNSRPLQSLNGRTIEKCGI